MKLGIRTQAVIGIGLIETSMLLLLLYSVFEFIDSYSASEVERRANSIARIFAATTADDVLSLDIASLQSFVDQAAATPGTAFARVTDYNGHLLAEAGNPNALHQAGQENGDGAELQVLHTARAEIIKADMSYGAVEVGLDLQEQVAAITAIKQRSLLIAALEIIAAAVFSIAAGFYLVRRLKKIRQQLFEANSGNYEPRIHDKMGDEVSDISKEVNKFIDRLIWETETRDQKLRELESINRIVKERIAQFDRLI